jgi:chromosome segregation ATPase
VSSALDFLPLKGLVEEKKKGVNLLAQMEQQRQEHKGALEKWKAEMAEINAVHSITLKDLAGEHDAELEEILGTRNKMREEMLGLERKLETSASDIATLEGYVKERELQLVNASTDDPGLSMKLITLEKEKTELATQIRLLREEFEASLASQKTQALQKDDEIAEAKGQVNQYKLFHTSTPTCPLTTHLRRIAGEVQRPNTTTGGKH